MVRKEIKALQYKIISITFYLQRICPLRKKSNKRQKTSENNVTIYMLISVALWPNKSI